MTKKAHKWKWREKGQQIGLLAVGVGEVLRNSPVKLHPQIQKAANGLILAGSLITIFTKHITDDQQSV